MPSLQNPAIDRRRTGGFSGAAILVLLGVIIGIWFAVTKIYSWWNADAKQELYEKVWESSPEFKRAYDKLGAEIKLVTKKKNDIEKLARVVESSSAKLKANHTIRLLDRKVEELTIAQNRIVGATEELALVTEASSVLTELDQTAKQDLLKDVENVLAYSSDFIEEALKDIPELKDLPPLPAPLRPAPPEPAPPKPSPPVVKQVFPTATRTWTSFAGTTIKGRVTAYNTSQAKITIERDDGKVWTNYSLWRLSRQDQLYLMKLAGVTN
jgi:hypothetical protein